MVTVISNTSNQGSTITISDGNTINDVFVTKVSVQASEPNQTVQIFWSETGYTQAFPVADFDPSYGTTADEIEAYISSLLVLPGGGSGGNITGSGAANQIAWFTSATNISSDNKINVGNVHAPGANNAIGIGKMPGSILDMTGVYGGVVQAKINNSNNSSADARSGFGAFGNTIYSAVFEIRNTSFLSSVSDIRVANQAVIQANTNSGLLIHTYPVAAPILFAVNGTTTGNVLLYLDTSYKVIAGKGAKNTGIGSSFLQVVAGSQTNNFAQVGGVLYSYINTATAGATEVSLYGSKIWGNTFLNAGDSIEGEYALSSDSDNMPAVNSLLNKPSGVAVDASGNLYIADSSNNKIRFVNAITGIITTYAGTGVAAYSGDGNIAINSTLNIPTGVFFDTSLNFLYIADQGNNVIRKVDAATGIISTYAGTGVQGNTGDGGAATSATLDAPTGVCVDATGSLYIADSGNNRVRIVSSIGTINNYAGDAGGAGGNSGDGGAATSATMNVPYGVLSTGSGILALIYITDSGNNRVRVVNAAGTINNYAGDDTGAGGNGGDGGTAIIAQLNNPSGLASDGVNVYIADTNNNRVRIVDGVGIINNYAGDPAGGAGNSGDGGSATSATFSSLLGIAISAGVLFIGDTNNNRVRNVGATPSHIVNNYAGNASAQSGYYFQATASLYFGVSGNKFGHSDDASITSGFGDIPFAGILKINIKLSRVSSSLLKISYTYIESNQLSINPSVINTYYTTLSYTNGAVLDLTQNNFLTLTGYTVSNIRLPNPQVNAVMGGVEWKSAN